MKVTFLFLFFFQISAFAQCDSTDIANFPDVNASFPGGNAAMLKFIQQNLEYPEIDRYACHQFTGKIYLEFIVCEDGTIQNIHLIRSTDSGFDQFAINLIEKMPNWIPAEINHHAVSSRCRLPISIYLQ